MAGEAIRSLAGVALFAGAIPAAGQAPPPPPRVVEFFHPTLRQHSLEAECGEGSASVTWAFDGKNAILLAFELGGQSLPAPQLAKIQEWMTEIGGDILIDLECGGAPDRMAASIRLINAQSAGSGVARGIRANIIDGTLSEFSRYNLHDM